MPVRHSSRYLWLAIAGAGLAIVAYIYLYEVQPLPGPWNDNFAALLISLAAICGAVVVTFTWRRFPPADRGPRQVWGNFALALWLWAAAETVVFGYYLLGLELPSLSVADILWLVGYVFFASALIHQYHLVYRTTRRREVGITLGVVGGLLVVGVVITVLFQQFAPSDKTWLETLVTVLYPLLDLAVGLAALWLVYAFGAGLLGRPWLGLFVFALADALYAWLEVTGIYQGFVATANPLSLATDVMYLAAYLVIAIACGLNLQLLRSGPPSAAAPEPNALQ
jgi:hypothetical protein